ncbi:uncharacterized protein LOC119355254 [Triticum dicoccoides]|uniref:uncharacterized protein LOC119355254 n=1 Tax=Triticum dicoccoides TaxID=85692 RepID=UPI0018900CB7|nr:uncharacterized protein LOC119355254 [Triticum dicoccoides]
MRRADWVRTLASIPSLPSPPRAASSILSRRCCSPSRRLSHPLPSLLLSLAPPPASSPGHGDHERQREEEGWRLGAAVRGARRPPLRVGRPAPSPPTPGPPLRMGRPAPSPQTPGQKGHGRPLPARAPALSARGAAVLLRRFLLVGSFSQPSPPARRHLPAVLDHVLWRRPLHRAPPPADRRRRARPPRLAGAQLIPGLRLTSAHVSIAADGRRVNRRCRPAPARSNETWRLAAARSTPPSGAASTLGLRRDAWDAALCLFLAQQEEHVQRVVRQTAVWWADGGLSGWAKTAAPGALPHVNCQVAATGGAIPGFGEGMDGGA